MLNRLRSFFNRRKSPGTDLDLNTLYTRFRDLPEPQIEEQRRAYEEFRAEINTLLQAAADVQLKPDVFKLMLEALVRNFEIPVEAIQANFKLMKGDWKADMQARHWAVPLITENLARYLDEVGGPNFAETVLELRVGGTRHPDVSGFVLTLQRLDGKCPADLLAECKQELAALQEQSREWRRSRAWLEGRNASPSIEANNPYVGTDETLEHAWIEGWRSRVPDDEEMTVDAVKLKTDDTPIANFYGQRSPHDPVYIVGNMEALCKLVNTFVYATIYNRPQRLSLFASDGEGFELVVFRQEEVLQDTDLQLPYTDPDWVAQPSVHPSELLDR